MLAFRGQMLCLLGAARMWSLASSSAPINLIQSLNKTNYLITLILYKYFIYKLHRCSLKRVVGCTLGCSLSAGANVVPSRRCPLAGLTLSAPLCFIHDYLLEKDFFQMEKKHKKRTGKPVRYLFVIYCCVF